MKASELRIGNFVQLNINITQVDVIDYNQIIATEFGLIELNYIKPIALTEEWLLKFGFEKDRNGYFLGILSFSITKNNKFMICINDSPIQTICNYVHQLQNLYFALTGEELIINN